jgi:hypothetical protein
MQCQQGSVLLTDPSLLNRLGMDKDNPFHYESDGPLSIENN